MQAETDLAKQIVQLLQDIIIQGADLIYEEQRKSAQGWEVTYPYSGPIMVFSIVDGSLILVPATDIKGQGTPEGWEPPEVSQIEECLKQFSQWQGRLVEDLEENLYLIQKHFRPLALKILNQVSSSYGFWPRDDPSGGIIIVSASPRTTNLFSGNAKDNDEVKLDDRLDAPVLKALVDEFNLLLARMKRVANRQKVPPVILPLPLPPHHAESKEGGGAGPDPSTATLAEDVARKSNSLSEAQPKPASTTPVEGTKPALAEGQSELRTQANKKSRIPNDAQKIIIRAINDGLSADRLCEFLDLNGLPPRKGWLHDQMYPWPGSYSKAWNIKGKIANFWHRKINIYVQNIKRDFADRIKVTKSPR